MNVLSMKDIVKKFGAEGFRAVDGVSLSVESGEIVSIIGASGSGKSTLLRSVCALEKIDEGTIVIDGDIIVKDGVYAKESELLRIGRKSGMVFQHFNLFPHLTVLQNVTISPVKIYGEAPDKANKRAMELLEMVGLASKAGNYPSQISGGQKQRVAIARALALSPKLMLFDEPTSALDPEISGEVLQAIRRLAKSGMTMLLVTHEMGFAREISNRVIYMDEGRIIEQGKPDELFGAPKSERLQAFLKAVIQV